MIFLINSRGNCDVARSGKTNRLREGQNKFSPGFSRKQAISGIKKTGVREIAPGPAKWQRIVENPKETVENPPYV
jgi:hypothetical protein